MVDYLRRHWRGDLSLARSYWIDGALLSVALGIAIVVVASIANAEYAPGRTLAVVTAIWTGTVVVLTWQFVGTWRSASRHRSRGGRRFWAITAKVFLIFGVLQFLGQFLGAGLPQLTEHVRILAGDKRMGPHALHVLRDGTELEFVGAITFGLTDEIRAALDANPNVRVIHLNSIGGRVGEARKLRELIRERGLVTYTPVDCVSACTIAFIGGRQRYIGPRARLGFHQASFPGVTQAFLAAPNNADRQALVDAGVDEEFAKRAYATPPERIWFPTNQELIAAWVITGVATNSDFAISGELGRSNPQDIAQELTKMRAYAAVQKAEPELFDQMVDELGAAIRAGRTEAEAIGQLRPRVVMVATKYQQRASNAALLDMGRMTVAQLERIGAKDPEVCFRLVMDTTGAQPIDVRPYMTPEMIQKELDNLAALIESGAADPQTVPSQQDIAPTFRGVVERLNFRLRNAGVSFDELRSPTPDHIKVCRVTTEMYREIMDLPPDQAAALLRFLAAQK